MRLSEISILDALLTYSLEADIKNENEETLLRVALLTLNQWLPSLSYKLLGSLEVAYIL